MNTLQSIEPGFANETDDSQRCFRAAMKALSRPGLAVPLPSDLRIIDGASPTAAALLLALVDQDTSVYLSESRAGTSLRSWLKFHTDCRLTVDRRRADFAWFSMT